MCSGRKPTLVRSLLTLDYRIRRVSCSQPFWTAKRTISARPLRPSVSIDRALCLDGLDAALHASRNLVVAVSLSNELQHLGLAVAEVEGRAVAGKMRPRELPDYHCCDTLVEVHVSSSDNLHSVDEIFGR